MYSDVELDGASDSALNFCLIPIFDQVIGI